MAEEGNHQPKLPELLAEVMARLPGIGKEHTMGSGNWSYKYRSIEDITPHIQKAFGELGIVVLPIVSNVHTEDTGKYIALDVKWTFHGPGDDTLVAITHAEAKDSSDKATQKAMTSAYKQMLQTVFVIGDPDDDLDNAKQDAPSPGRSKAPAKQKPVADAKPGPQNAILPENAKLAEMFKHVPQANRDKLRDKLAEEVGENLLTRKLAPADYAKAENIILKWTPVQGLDTETGEIIPPPVPAKSKAQLLMIKGKADLGLSDDDVREFCAIELGVAPSSLKSLKQLTEEEAEHCLQKMDWTIEARKHG